MWLITAFAAGYLLIIFEHRIHIEKAASALLTGMVLWTMLTLPQVAGVVAPHLDDTLMEHLGEIASILFFLIGAMTIVDLIDSHDGFRIITDRIRTANKVKLLWLVSIVTFFLSAILDNLTTAIVMATMLRRLVDKKEDLWLFAGFVVIAANSGGAWSPMGDITTIMLWIGGQISALHIVGAVFLPSVVSLLVPLGLASLYIKGTMGLPESGEEDQSRAVSKFDSQLVLYLGIAALLFVQVFKHLTHLPPFMGILLGLSVLWLTTELLHRKKDPLQRNYLSVAATIHRIDTPSVLFFLGILLAVAALQTAGILGALAQWLDHTFANLYIINALIGLLSAIVDNVPLVAGAMGMYSLDTYAQDHEFWTLLAYCAGTGGSALIIGSAAGVAIMGILKIDFLWYVKRVSLLAVAGYLAGLGVYWLMH